MIDKVREEFNKLEVTNRREIVLEEMMELYLLIEKVCIKKNIDIKKIKKEDILVNKSNLGEKEYLDYIFNYILNLKEDLGLLLENLWYNSQQGSNGLWKN